MTQPILWKRKKWKATSKWRLFTGPLIRHYSNGNVININAMFLHEFFLVTIIQRVGYIPANSLKNDLFFWSVVRWTWSSPLHYPTKLRARDNITTPGWIPVCNKTWNICLQALGRISFWESYKSTRWSLNSCRVSRIWKGISDEVATFVGKITDLASSLIIARVNNWQRL